MFSPAISALLEQVIGLQAVMYAIPVIYGVILAMLVASLKWRGPSLVWPDIEIE
jgi:TsgA-like MFS transporter